MIPFHKTYITGNEKALIDRVISSGSLSGNGAFTEKCHDFFQTEFGFKKVLLTNSCTDALEMCALLLDIKQGDEIILPSYTFVSTANAFFNYGAKPVFIDSEENNPNMDADKIEAKITPETKAIVVMHYAGIACEMNKIKSLAKKHNLKIIEDAALGLGSKYQNEWLGGFGDLAAFSFHQTKNITCGEGGLLVINNPEYFAKAEIIWEKGTNRSAFLRGESDKYEWVSKGSSFLTSEIHAAFLFAQLTSFRDIQTKRISLWNKYKNELKNNAFFKVPETTDDKIKNGSVFYLILKNEGLVDAFIQFMKENGVVVSKHYRCLHDSIFYKNQFSSEKLINCQKIASQLVRLPLYTDLTDEEQNEIIKLTKKFFN